MTANFANLRVRLPARCKCGAELAVIDQDRAAVKRAACGICRRLLEPPFVSFLAKLVQIYGRPTEPIKFNS